MSITRAWKVYGEEGHRQHESFFKSYEVDCSEKGFSRIIKVENSDITGTNEYSIIRITRNTAQECQEELDDQLSDGAFECSKVGKVVEITEDAGETCSTVMITPCHVSIKRYYQVYAKTKEGTSKEEIIKQVERDIIEHQDLYLSPDPDMDIEPDDIAAVLPDIESQWAEKEDKEIQEILSKHNPDTAVPSISRIAYELYKLKWTHDSTILSENMGALREYWLDVIAKTQRGIKPESFEEWLEKGNGYSGSLYASYEEFLMNDYNDPYLMEILLKNKDLIRLYQMDRDEALEKEIKNILAESISEDYMKPILEKCLGEIVEDVKTSSDYLGEGTYDDSDIRLAIGRVFIKKMGQSV